MSAKSAGYIIDNFPKALNEYIFQWRILEKEYSRIPSWRFFKQMNNIRKREKLTKAFVCEMKDWGLIP